MLGFNRRHWRLGEEGMVETWCGETSGTSKVGQEQDGEPCARWGW